jgi:hypothetical protein
MPHHHPEESNWLPHTRALWGPDWYISRRALKYRSGQHVTPKQHDRAREAWERETYGAPLEQLERAAPTMFLQLRAAGIEPDIETPAAAAIARAEA